MSDRYIDKHDVRAFCARAREMLDLAEDRAVRATGPGWLLERKENADHARAFLDRTKDALDELMANLNHSIEADEKLQEAETSALLGGDELVEGDESATAD